MHIYVDEQRNIPNNSSRGITHKGTKYFIVRKENVFFAYVNRCPHLGVPLDWENDKFLDSDNDLIQCATHGALFLIEDGTCISGPCRQQKLEPVELLIDKDKIYLNV